MRTLTCDDHATFHHCEETFYRCDEIFYRRDGISFHRGGGGAIWKIFHSKSFPFPILVPNDYSTSAVSASCPP